MAAKLDHEVADLRRRLDEALAERDEADAQKAALAEILEVINASPGNPAPVFQRMLEKVMTLCGASFGELRTYDGERFSLAAAHGMPTAYTEYYSRHDTGRYGPGTGPARLLAGERIIHIKDLVATEPYQRGDPDRHALVDLAGARAYVLVPLLLDGSVRGYILIFRQEPRPFTDKQIALLQNFAAQAVLAMENARVLSELSQRTTDLHESLEYQTATSNVLRVISRSDADLGSVLENLIATATRLCQADFGLVFRLHGDDRHHLIASYAATREFEEYLVANPFPQGRGTLTGRVAAERRAVVIEDAANDPEYTWTEGRQVGELRTGLGVPLLRDNILLGTFILYRSRVERFTEKQIKLVTTFADQAVIAIENARLLGELRQRTGDLQESLEYQTATSDVLKVISRSTFDLQPVLQTVVETATRLCEADMGFLLRRQGDEYRAGAAVGYTKEYEQFMRTHPLAVDRGSITGRVALEDRTVHIEDVTADPEYTLSESTTLAGQRTALGVPLLREGQSVGVIVLARKRVEPFTDKQIELVNTFADQAVIAIENTRLITETREALEQQTATAEVLQVINSSPGDLAPVFDAMLDKSLRLCAAAFGFLWTWDGEQMHRLAFRGLPGELIEELREPLKPPPGSIPERIVTGERVVFDIDVLEGPRRSPTLARLGARSCVGVALRKDEKLLGGITIYRREVRPFAEKQLVLLGNFAAQAVIAMENARLITETREALEQQTATADVLSIINSSPGDLSPVFGAMLDKATTLCEATFGILWVRDGNEFHAAALRGVPAAYAEVARQPQRPRPDNPLGRMLRGERLIISADVAAEDLYRQGDPVRRALVDLGGAHSAVQVALVKDDSLLGSLTVFRQEVRPFSEKQIALLENFAAQAVIAMENTRLITETREALEQQTATAEVLGVINSSPGDLAPVFDAMLEKAMRLCEASFGELRNYEDGIFHIAATRGVPQAYAEFMAQNPPNFGPSTGPGRILEGERFIHIVDLPNTENYRNGEPNRRALVDLAGAKTLVLVPLLKDATVLGYIMFYRLEVRPFTNKQIALLQNFAAQAVIAMENARLITETREALEQQTATAEVLGVINSSPGDLAPVFDAILEKAHNLCGAEQGVLVTYDGENFQGVATHGLAESLAEVWRKPSRATPGSGQERLLRGERLVHIADVASVDAERPDHPFRRAIIEAGFRTLLMVPLRKEGNLLGYITAIRNQVNPFNEKQISLLENFAAQAVIAMENARLITETREALDQQTATAEVLGVINSSPGDLAPVFDAMLKKATTLCEAAFGILWRFNGEFASAAALYQVPRDFADFWREPRRPGPDTGPGRMMRGEGVFAIADTTEYLGYLSGDPIVRAIVDLGGARSLVVAPLRKEDTTLGAITIYRQEVRPFTDKQITLLQNFAAQAVIAMENARLMSETREALDQQTATAEVLGVINSSPGDLAPVFDAMLERAVHLSEAAFGIMNVHDGERFQAVALHGVPAGFKELWTSAPPSPGPRNALSRMVDGEDVVHIEDLGAYESYQSGDARTRLLVEVGSARSLLAVALRKDGMLLGSLTAYRQEVRPFSEKQISLLQNFAAQAVIAMENARLLDEIRQRQAELRVTFDNMGDGVVMFDENLRLAAWNRNFQEMLDLPDAALAERPNYSDYLRILAERGEFGTEDIETEVSRRLENTEQEFRQERTRPDGRVIEVRRNAVPDGGFVLIYSDITERKRSEAEIHAARDAAEAAYRDLKAAQSNLIQAQKMAALGQLTAGIAHEIKNPLNFVNNFAGLSVELLDELKETAAPAIETLDEDTRSEIDDTIEMLTGNLEKIAEHGRRADGIVKSMLEHSRGVTSERRKVDLNNLVEEALNLAYHGARAQDQNFNITLEREYDRGVAEIELVPQEVNRVFINLIGNGFYATAKRQRDSREASFRPILRVATRDLGEAVEVRIRDNGTGIPTEIKDKLFQPFFTTKPTGEGTGLGLSISYDIVAQQHGGTIEVESEVGEFTEFTVRLPRTYRAATAEAAS
jgi:PAS domain S-box-containing protein